MKYLLVGGAGFIGSYVYNRLRYLHPEAKIDIIDNLDCYHIMTSTEYQRLLANRLDDDVNKIHKIDINDRTKIFALIETLKPDIIIHFAAYPRAALVERYPVQGVTTMTLGLKNVLDAAKGIARHFVYASSSMVYGDFPIDHAPNETTSCNPKSTYGIYKLAGEQLVKGWSEETGGTYTIIRPSAVYGPKDVTERVISLFFAQAMHGSELVVMGAGELLDFTYIDDIVHGFVAAANQHVSETFNITGGQPATLLEAAELIIDIVGGGSIKLQPRDTIYPRRGGLDIRSAKEKLHLPASVPLKTGLTLYYDWLKEYSI